MIIHVASADENEGRVIVQFRSPNPNRIALRAACRIAQVFDSEIEGILIEPNEALEMAAYPFTREISLSGREVRNLDAGQVASDIRRLANTIRKQFQSMARAGHIPCRFSITQGDPVAAIANACQRSGPWNIVTVADALDGGALWQLDQLFETVANTTGIVVCGPKTRQMSGPTIIVAEDIERLPGMLKTAKRLSGETREIILLMVAQTDTELTVLEGQMRLALGTDLGQIKLAMSELTRGEPKVLAEVLRRLNGGFVIGRYGGLLLNNDMDAMNFLRILHCPLLLTP